MLLNAANEPFPTANQQKLPKKVNPKDVMKKCFGTENCEMMKGITESIGLYPFAMQEDNSEDTCYGFTTKEQFSLVHALNNKKVTFTAINGEDEEKTGKKPSMDNNLLDFYISTNIINSKPLINDTYTEIGEDVLGVLNTDWEGQEFLCPVNAQSLAGSILVSNDQIPLINCVCGKRGL